jgi:6-hydroxytryprostatin B O-methyltransferase
MTSGFLDEPEANKLGHSQLSAAFLKDPTLKDWGLFVAEESAAVSHLVEATEKWGETESKTQTAYGIAKNTDLSFFEYLSTDKSLTARFAGYMKNVTNQEATSMKNVVRAFDWSSLGAGTVIDIGGSTGHATLAVAQEFPKLKFIIQDLLKVVESSAQDLSRFPESVSSRISYQPYDFFQPQPVKGADAYFMRTIIHDWPRKEAIDIISNVAAAMAPQGKSRFLIMDIVLPPPGTAAIFDEALARLRDITMMQTFNAKERELSDWEELIGAVGQGLVIKAVNRPFGSLLSLIEIVKEAEVTPATNGTNGVNGANGANDANGDSNVINGTANGH